MSDLTQEQQDLIDRLRDEHKKIAVFALPDGEIVVLAGTKNKEEYGRYFNAMVNPGGDKAGASFVLALACALHPERPKLVAWLKDHPGDASDFAAAAAELSSSGAKKLEGN